MIDQSLFNKHFVGRDGFNWWIGQIPPEESWRGNITGKRNKRNTDADGFGERYRVRIMGYHTANADDIPDDELPWAYVMYPVTAGSGGRGSSQNANITQGAFVFGWFMDGEDAQLPIIMGVLGNNDYTAVMRGVTPTRFIPFSGYPEQDTVHRSERSTLQVRGQQGGGTPPDNQIIRQDNAEGNPTNNQITESVQGNVTSEAVADPPPEPKEPLPVTSECEKAPVSAMVTQLANVMNEIQRINQMIYDAHAAITAGIADAQKYISNLIKKATSAVSGVMKWIFTEIQKFVLNKLNFVIKNTFSLIPPDFKEQLKLAVEASNDIVACLFKRLMGQLPDMIGGFLGDLFGLLTSGGSINIGLGIPTKAVNIPQCFLENFIGTSLGNTVSVITSALNDAVSQVTGVLDSVAGALGGALGSVASIIGDTISFIDDIISFLTCEVKPKCPRVKEWSITSGAGTNTVTNLNDLVSGARNIASSVSGIGNQIRDIGNQVSNIGSLTDIDFSGVFDSSSCDVGPRSCGPPTVGYIGQGEGAQINLVISGEGGEIMGVDIISSGFNFSEGNSFLTVSDDCGIGQGSVLRPVFGPVIPNPNGPGTIPGNNRATGLGPIPGGNGTIPGADASVLISVDTEPSGLPRRVEWPPEGDDSPTGLLLPPDSDSDEDNSLGNGIGIVDVIIVESGYGYLPSPNGSSGGDGSLWKPASYTTVIGDGSFNPGNGSSSGDDDGKFGNDYYAPIPPGKTIPIPPGSTVTTPANSKLTEGFDNEGNGVEILPGTPTLFLNGGSMTSPTIMEDIDIVDILYPSTSSYPVIMYLCELIVDKSGVDYQSTDEVVIEPDMGATATPKFDDFGRLLSIKVTAGGEGFKQIPEVYIKTKTGFGSKITPKFCIDRLGENDLEREPGLQDKVLSVVDCVGAV